MRDTPVPEGHLDLQPIRVAAALQRAKRALIVRPPPRALDVAQAALLPLLHSLGVDVFDLDTLRLAEAPSAESARFRLLAAGLPVAVEVLAATATLPGPVPAFREPALHVVSNGRSWSVQAASHNLALEFGLFDDGFPEALAALLSDGVEGTPPSPAERVGRAADTLRLARLGDGVERLVSRLGPERARLEAEDLEGLTRRLQGEGLLREEDFVSAEPETLELIERQLRAGERGEVRPGPLQQPTLDDVRRHATEVRALRGKLAAWFDGTPVEITSRSALYYVLAALALQHGRQDAIPGEDLVCPPDQPPAGRRATALGRPGWYLLIDHDAAAVESRTAELLGSLRLRERLTATQRGRPYPEGR